MPTLSCLLTSGLAILLLGVAACGSDAPDPTPPGDEAPPAERIVFFGDSITQAGAEPGGYVSRIADTLAARYPDRDIEVIGAGISGHKVPDLQARLDRDVLAHDPTQVVIYIGINDVWHWFEFDPEGTEREVYEAGLRDLVAQIQGAGARVWLCTPSVIGEQPGVEPEIDAMLDDYADVSRRVAAETGADLCDLRRAFLDHLAANNPDGLAEDILTTDGVHLNNSGNAFVAKQMLQALGL